MVNAADTEDELRRLLDSAAEWLLSDSRGKSFALNRAEIEIESAPSKILISLLDEKGLQTWRVKNWRHENPKLIFELTKNFGRESVKLELIPRTSARDFVAAGELARAEKAAKIAALITSSFPHLKLLRVELNKENGRFAQMMLADARENRTAVLAEIGENLTPEIILGMAILRLEKLRNRRKNRAEHIWILAEPKNAANLQKIHALLENFWRGAISIKSFSLDDAETKNRVLENLEVLSFENLWKRKKKSRKFKAEKLSKTAARIVEFAPPEIDILQEKNGETLRFAGLKFARIRKIGEEENVWFGIGNRQQRLGAHNFVEFTKLLDELKIYRNHNSPNKKHLFYQAASEAWLESVLRKNIRALDANLILSPLHTQFQAVRDRIDLLAMRRDGRLVIIEVKTSPDREMIFQAADYWRKIEAERICGNLDAAGIFGDLKIKNEPTLVYLVAPLLAFDKNFDFLAQTISRKIEIYRFDLNENWRQHLKVVRQREIRENR